jgi:isopropylmalate/homocitrate/citramalate synthase
MAIMPNLSYQTFIIPPQKLGNRRNVVSRNASTKNRAVKNTSHTDGEFDDANVSTIFAAF